MKLRYSTIDLVAAIAELKDRVVGMRFNQVYDIDNKTYLFRLNRQDEKVTLLVESGVRIHWTDFEWPKNAAPSGFTMKLRKHLKNKRLQSLAQLGDDRILDLQFGSGEVAHHVIVELYDKGNLVLTDWKYLILNILRPRAVGGDQEGKLVVRESYPVNAAKRREALPSAEGLATLFASAKMGDNIRKVLNPHLIYGPAVIDHVLARAGFPRNCRLGKEFDASSDCQRLERALQEAEEVLREASEKSHKGYVIQKVTRMVLPGGEEKESRTFEEFHPFLYEQHGGGAYLEFDSFNRAVDHFFSSMESQRIDSRTAQKEREALKKLDNVRQDHDKRVRALQEHQQEDVRKARLVENNLELVDKAILVVRSAIANQIGWASIADLVKEARNAGDPVAAAIKTLQLDKNHISMSLKDPYGETNEDGPSVLDIDLDLSAYANARKFYDKKRHAVKKEQKTLESSEKAYKNAEKRTKQTLKEVAVISAIVKARKSFWFEKFLWFVSSENYLVIGGRDIQQNEMLVRRYLKKGDLYVHADLHGASSIVIKNPSGNPVPPKTLNEAGTMALCYSSAWDAKVVTSAWWVHHHQVSKTAPTGEYLTPGSFMIRGKKNFLPPSHLVVGFGFLFKVDEDSLERHKNERCVHGDEVNIELVEDSAEEELMMQEEDSDHVEESERPEEQESGGHQEEDLSFPDTIVQHRTLQPTSVDTDMPENEMSVSGQHKKMTSHRPQKNEIEEKSKESEAIKKGPKRGQRSKMKKIKEKYGDQDEEERRLRMEILASAGEKKTTPKKVANVVVPVTKAVGAPKPLPNPKPTAEVKDDSDHEQQAEEETPSNEDEATLSALTGCPVAEDSLVFAVPVCAPYAAVVNYKYKVKVMPGNGRRGKSAKMALAAFMHDRMATSREKDLLRSVKDQDISRNLPGKVKMVVAKKR